MSSSQKANEPTERVRQTALPSPGRCPLCGEQLYGWIALPPLGTTTAIGDPIASEAEERVIDRCENCGVALERGREIDVEVEWEAVCRPGQANERALAIPNRASLQAWIGEVGWAGLDRYPGRLIHTPDSLERLAALNGYRIARSGSPFSRRAQAWMWQTILNGLTFHPNYAREVRAGRLRPSTARSRLKFGVDAVVTILGAPLVLLLSVPLELGAGLVRRGGEMVATAQRTVDGAQG